MRHGGNFLNTISNGTSEKIRQTCAYNSLAVMLKKS